MINRNNSLDDFLNQYSMTLTDTLTSHFVLTFISRWTAGDSKMGTNRIEDLFFDEFGDVYVLMGSGGFDTFWGGGTCTKILILSKDAGLNYLNLRAFYDEAHSVPQFDLRLLTTLDSDEDNDWEQDF